MAKVEKGKLLIDSKQLDFILQSLALEVIENHSLFNNSIIVGIQPRGIVLCDIIHSIIEKRLNKKILKGYIDISLHRDDIHLQDTHIDMRPTKMPYSVEGKNVILIDDVLFTGRTIRAALDTIIDLGRPKDIELLVLVDRRLHRNVPIQAKYVGKKVDSIHEERVNVYLNSENDRVEFL